MAGAVGPTGLPKIQLMPTRISVMPITAIMVPVTTGGKKRSMRLTAGAIRMDTTPAPMMEPNNSCAYRPRLGRGHGRHGRDRGEGDAHHDGQLDAEPARGAQRLDQRDQPATEQVGGDQHGHFLGAELQRPADDERHRDGAGVHHEHVLQAQGGQLDIGKALVDGMPVWRTPLGVSGRRGRHAWSPGGYNCCVTYVPSLTSGWLGLCIRKWEFDGESRDAARTRGRGLRGADQGLGTGATAAAAGRPARGR